MTRLFLIVFAAFLGPALPTIAAPVLLQVESATIARDPLSGFNQLQVDLAPESARTLTKFTSRHVGEVVEMWVDGKLVMSPMIQTVIVGGQIMISGNFSRDELDSMADRLNANETAIELIVPDDR